MSTVTVAGANGQTVVLTFDTEANAALAQRIASAITAGVQNGSILASDDSTGPPLPLPPGATGEFVQTKDGMTALPPGYKAFIDTAAKAVVFGSGDADESVLSSVGRLDFIATGGSGTVVAGGGNNLVSIPGGDSGDWSINTGKGDDVIFALGAGNNSISAGAGHNAILLGGGNSLVNSTGDDTVSASGGQATITAIGDTSDVIYGGAKLFYIGNLGGPATIYGGAGSVNYIGGTGPDLVHGGTAGDNFLFAGTGNATLFGGGDGDQLFAAGNAGQELHAGAGNELLNGLFASGADTFFASTGNSTIVGGGGNDSFVFTNGQGGGTDSVQGFHPGDTIDLQGYGRNEVRDALKSQTVTDGSVTITLSDHTTITFAGVTSLSPGDFITTGGAGGNGNGHGDNDDGDNDHGHGRDDDHGDRGHQGHGDRHDGDDMRHIRDMPIGPSDH